MKKQWLVAGLIGLASVSVLTACGAAEKKEEAKQEATSKTSESSTKESTKESTTESSSSSSSSSAAEKKETTTAAAGFTAKNYADLDNMEFAINGKVYRVGETTLQTLIDDGVPFEQNSLNNAGNNVNPNASSSTFNVVVGDYWNLQLTVSNFTETAAAAKDLPISDLYFPLKKDRTQDVLTFAFPFDVTMDALKANAGEPTEVDHYEAEDGYTSDGLLYEYDSSKYFGQGGYEFEFIRGQFDGVFMKYLPR